MEEKGPVGGSPGAEGYRSEYDCGSHKQPPKVTLDSEHFSMSNTEKQSF